MTTVFLWCFPVRVSINSDRLFHSYYIFIRIRHFSISNGLARNSKSWEQIWVEFDVCSCLKTCAYKKSPFTLLHILCFHKKKTLHVSLLPLSICLKANNSKPFLFALVLSRLQTSASQSGASCPSVKARGPSPQRWGARWSTCPPRSMKPPRAAGLTWNTTCTGETPRVSTLWFIIAWIGYTWLIYELNSWWPLCTIFKW